MPPDNAIPTVSIGFIGVNVKDMKPITVVTAERNTALPVDAKNTIDQTNAVSIVFLMKSVGLGGNVSGTALWNITDNPIVPDDLKLSLIHI